MDEREKTQSKSYAYAIRWQSQFEIVNPSCAVDFELVLVAGGGGGAFKLVTTRRDDTQEDLVNQSTEIPYNFYLIW